ncbi:hypothetical protein CR513_09258, partial [Mucuna pruriens]
MALCHRQLFQKRIKSAFDKKVRLRSFKEGDLVLKKILPNSRDQGGKSILNYEGPYVVKLTFSIGAVILADSEGQELKHPVNADAQLADQLKDSLRRTFETRFGSVLDLMEVEIQLEALTALVQFYDPPLRSFQFQDFQMAPTLDEYERILDQPLTKNPPYLYQGNFSSWG